MRACIKRLQYLGDHCPNTPGLWPRAPQLQSEPALGKMHSPHPGEVGLEVSHPASHSQC